MTAARQFDYSIDQIKAALNARPVELAHALGLYGRQGSGEYWVRDFRAGDGGNLTSFGINLTKGIWKNFRADEGGDLLHLVAVFACGGDDRRAVKWALDWLGWSGHKPDPKRAAELRQKARETEQKAREAELKRRGAARKLWLDGEPLDGTDPASQYLKARGIDVTKIPGGIPRSLKFVPECAAFPENVRLPALVACIACEGVGIMAAHRTYLAAYSGVWKKAFAGETREGRPVPAKRVLGPFAGGSIRLTRGPSGKSLKDAPAGEWVAIGEGIENVLSVALARPDLRCLAAVSIGNIGNVQLPAQIGGVYILADNDQEPIAIKAFDRAMDLIAGRGIEPVIVRAQGGFKDFNDAVMGAARV